MTFSFIGLPEALQEGTRRLLELKNCHIRPDGRQVAVRPGDVLSVRIFRDSAELVYPPGGFFRALGLLLQNAPGFAITEEPRFENLGLQLDLSRNGAMNVPAIKKMMDHLALMGYNQLYLYLEDMYCLPGREYFGYFRGRYTPAELKELDDYAATYGMELIPSIQTLGHMEQYLRWEEAADVQDTQRELLADSEATYRFIEAMIRAATEPLRTKKIVLGLDEAHNLGLGKYLDRNGYVKKEEIFCRHLKKVFEITDKLGLEGILYSDMFFRMAAPDSDYYNRETVIPQTVIDEIPENATLIYWHYGEAPGCDDCMVQAHLAIGRKTLFYGGTWTWSGHLPHTRYAICATREGLEACHKHGISTAVQTIWGDDDGGTCSHFYSLLTLQDMAEWAFGHQDEDWIAQRFRFCTDGDMDAFLAMSDYQSKLVFGEDTQNFMELFRGKTLFWQDIMMGQADEYLENTPMSEFYGAAAAKFATFARENTPWQAHYAYIERLFSYMSLKCAVAEKLQKAYREENREVLAEICRVSLPGLLEILRDIHARHGKLWLKDYKPFGWEVSDRHYGGSEARISYGIQRLEGYLQGEISCLEELTEKRLPMSVNPWNVVRRIASATADF